jgi:hypothetical protein
LGAIVRASRIRHLLALFVEDDIGGMMVRNSYKGMTPEQVTASKREIRRKWEARKRGDPEPEPLAYWDTQPIYTDVTPEELDIELDELQVELQAAFDSGLIKRIPRSPNKGQQ